MNHQRYLMPAIIAASLHSALVYFFSENYPPPPPAPKDPPVARPDDTPQILMTDPEPETGSAGDGKAEPLPAQVDIPRAAVPEDIFKIEVRPSAVSIRPVLKLPENPSGPIGPDDSGVGVGRPSLPSVINLDQAPRATVRPVPNYPASLRDTSGSVTVEFVVDTTGRVVSADAVRWTHRDFVDPAVRAVRRWRFEPGTINGRKVSFRMAVPIEFNTAY